MTCELGSLKYSYILIIIHMCPEYSYILIIIHRCPKCSYILMIIHRCPKCSYILIIIHRCPKCSYILIIIHRCPKCSCILIIIHRCPKCRRWFKSEDTYYRYRLCATITDFLSSANITAFGGMLDVFYGETASKFYK